MTDAFTTAIVNRFLFAKLWLLLVGEKNQTFPIMSGEFKQEMNKMLFIIKE